MEKFIRTKRMNNSSSSTESVNVLNLWLWKTNCLRSQSESETVANIRLARLKIIHVYHHLLIIIDKTLYVHLRVSISRLAISSIKNIPFSSPYPRYAHRNAHDIHIYIYPDAPVSKDIITVRYQFPDCRQPPNPSRFHPPA